MAVWSGVVALALVVTAAGPAVAEDRQSSPGASVRQSASGDPRSGSAASGDVPGTLATIRGEALGARQWGLRAIGAEGAWGITRGAGITVAVLDSGVDRTHPDLAGRLLPTRDLVGDGNVGDPFGHGTRIAGIIAGVMDGAGIAGLASDVRVLPIRVLAADGEGDQRRTARGIREAVEAGAQVINLSLSSQTRSTAQAQAIEYALARGVTVVAAAGNRRTQGSPTVFPAAYPGVIGVSSVAPTLRASKFASRGSFIDLAAPGQRILTTLPGGRWGNDDGTSLAAAYVAGAAALVRAANPTLDREEADRILTSTAIDLGAPGHDETYGHGLLHVGRAVRAAADLPGGVRVPSVTVDARAVSSAAKLRVDVGPDLTAGSWRLRIQRLQADGTWRTLPTGYRTRGAKETRVVDLPAGTYRVKVASRFGLRGGVSEALTLPR